MIGEAKGEVTTNFSRIGWATINANKHRWRKGVIQGIRKGYRQINSRSISLGLKGNIVSNQSIHLSASNLAMKITKGTSCCIGKEHATTNFTSRRLATKSPTKHYCAFGKEIYLISLACLGTSTVTPTVVKVEEEFIAHLFAPVEYLHFVQYSCPPCATSIHCLGSKEYLFASDNLGRGRALVYSPVGEKVVEWDMVDPSVSVSGWSGIISYPADPTSTVIATFYDKGIRIFDTDRMLRHWKCVQHPTQISFLPEKNLLAVLEYNQITLWDLRGSAPTQRLTTVLQPLMSHYMTSHVCLM